MAKEYIEREAAINRLQTVSMPDDPYSKGIQRGVEHAIDVIMEAPTADVVEVVRCRDCKHWKHFDHLGCTIYVKVCGLANYMIGENGYCLYGERRDNNAAD